MIRFFIKKIIYIGAFFPTIIFAAGILKIPQPIWDALTTDQQVSLTGRYTVSLVAAKSYGTIIDIQIVNESTPGSNAGSRLGAAYGSAAYVDNAFKGQPRNWNYSATNNITASLVGAAIGSLADQPAVARFHTRYTVRTGSGNVEYIDEIKGDAFRHTNGLCMTLNPLRTTETDLCNLNREQFIEKHLGASVTLKNIAPIANKATKKLSEPTPLKDTNTTGEYALCKFGLASPVRIKTEICTGNGGELLID